MTVKFSFWLLQFNKVIPIGSQLEAFIIHLLWNIELPSVLLGDEMMESLQIGHLIGGAHETWGFVSLVVDDQLRLLEVHVLVSEHVQTVLLRGEVDTLHVQARRTKPWLQILTKAHCVSFKVIISLLKHQARKINNEVRQSKPFSKFKMLTGFVLQCVEKGWNNHGALRKAQKAIIGLLLRIYMVQEVLNALLHSSNNIAHF